MTRARVTFKRQGDAYLLSNGAIELRGELCGARLVQSIRADGQECGLLDAIIKISVDGKIQWPGISSLCDVRFRAAGDAGVLDLIGEWWELIPPWNITGVAFRAHVRLTIKPGESEFLAEFIRLENSGTKAFSPERLCFNALPPGNVSPIPALRSSNAQKISAWKISEGLSFGLRSEDEAIGRFAFWVDAKSGCPHGDCGFDSGTATELLPGHSLGRPFAPGVVVFVKRDEQ